ncbi:MAG: hypothetical protein ACTHKG_21915 [Nocardioides sp.]
MTRHPNRILAVVLGVIAVVAVVAVVLATNREPQTYDRGTPQGVVQAYLEAVVAGDNTEAAGYLAPGGACDIEDLDRSSAPDGIRVVMRDTQVDGDRAQVEVDVVTSSDDLFGGSEWSERHTFRLGKDGQDWRVQGVPWPMYDCDKEG